MLYEYRRYEVMPGKLPARTPPVCRGDDENLGEARYPCGRVLGGRFGTSNELNYMLAWEDVAERDRKWEAFPQGSRLAERAGEERRGRPLVARVNKACGSLPTILR